jgi:hypothetical protein
MSDDLHSFCNWLSSQSREQGRSARLAGDPARVAKALFQFGAASAFSVIVPTTMEVSLHPSIGELHIEAEWESTDRESTTPTSY